MSATSTAPDTTALATAAIPARHAVPRGVVAAAACVLIPAGLIDAWAGRFSFFAADTVSYMDMASGLAQGDLSAAVAGHWSPLYPAFIAVFMHLVGAVPPADFAAARVLNMAVFIAAFAVFHMFLERFVRRVCQVPTGGSECPVPPACLAAIGYAAFAWSCFSLTLLGRINPDICVLAVVCAVAWSLLCFSEGFISRPRFAGFGAVLATGYLFKAIVFPLSFLFMAIAAALPSLRRRRIRILIALAVFLALSLPLAIAISLKYDRVTFGESGRYSYGWEVLLYKPYVHWQGEPAGSGTPLHPTRQIMRNPDVFEFATPIVATYAPWYDPTYWNAGLNVHFDADKQVRAVARNLRNIALVLLHDRFANVVLLILAAAALGVRGLGVSRGALVRLAPVWLVGMGVLAAYTPVLILPRYVAGGLLLLVLCALASVTSRDQRAARQAGLVLAGLCVLGVGWQCGPRIGQAAAAIAATRGHIRNDTWLVADALRAHGIAPGAPVAAIDPGDQHKVMDWARLSGVRVISEIPEDEDPTRQFWTYPADRQALALEALGRTGARAVVASDVPNGADTTGWTRIGHSEFYLRVLTPNRIP
jgi:hypothetical protein